MQLQPLKWTTIAKCLSYVAARLLVLLLPSCCMSDCLNENKSCCSHPQVCVLAKSFVCPKSPLKCCHIYFVVASFCGYLLQYLDSVIKKCNNVYRLCTLKGSSAGGRQKDYQTNALKVGLSWKIHGKYMIVMTRKEDSKLGFLAYNNKIISRK